MATRVSGEKTSILVVAWQVKLIMACVVKMSWNFGCLAGASNEDVLGDDGLIWTYRK